MISQAIKLTYVIPFYIENQRYHPVIELLEIYNSYKKSVRNHTHFVLVDDHSPIKTVIPEDIQLNYTLLRIKDNIKWNQGGARNLGADYAKSDKLILTDLDIIFPEHLLEILIDYEIPINCAFKFKRVLDLKLIGPHFNVFFMTKETFQKSEGVDEIFCGNYGHEDTFFYFLQCALGTKFVIFPESNIVDKEHKYDLATNHNKLARDLGPNSILKDEKMKILRASENPMNARSNLYLNFEWEIVSEHLIC